MAAHESPRTTKLYDWTKERLTQDEVERIRGHQTICSKLHANRPCRSPLPFGAILKEGSESKKRQKSEVAAIHA
jgi:hypothetical protein